MRGGFFEKAVATYFAIGGLWCFLSNAGAAISGTLSAGCLYYSRFSYNTWALEHSHYMPAYAFYRFATPRDSRTSNNTWWGVRPDQSRRTYWFKRPVQS